MNRRDVELPRSRFGQGCHVGQDDRGRRSRTIAAAIATAQTGAMVMTKGRRVSLFEWETRSKARKTITVPTMRSPKPTSNASHMSDRIVLRG